MTQGAADLALIPLRRRQGRSPPTKPTARSTTFIAFVKPTLGDAVADVRASDRLTDSAVCLVAADIGPDRQLEKLLAGAGRIKTGRQADPGDQSAARSGACRSPSSTTSDRAFKEDAAHLLFDEARVLDGEQPADAARLLRPPRARARPRSAGRQAGVIQDQSGSV